ncbi:hypothetical protein [Nostoc punctiforme]|nr:hypothetical protein [Nostoc punctiforme]
MTLLSAYIVLSSLLAMDTCIRNLLLKRSHLEALDPGLASLLGWDLD